MLNNSQICFSSICMTLKLATIRSPFYKGHAKAQCDSVNVQRWQARPLSFWSECSQPVHSAGLVTPDTLKWPVSPLAGVIVRCPCSLMDIDCWALRPQERCNTSSGQLLTIQMIKIIQKNKMKTVTDLHTEVCFC